MATTQGDIRNAAELLQKYFALDTTLREVALVLRQRLEDGAPLEPLSRVPMFVEALPLFPPPDEPREEARPAGRRGGRKAPVAAEQASAHKSAIETFVRLWREKRGGEYRVVGGRDGKAIKELLKYPEATQGEIERRVRIALTDPFFLRAGTIAFFVSRWSSYDRALPVGPAGSPAQVPGPRQKVVGMNGDGSFRYA